MKAFIVLAVVACLLSAEAVNLTKQRRKALADLAAAKADAKSESEVDLSHGRFDWNHRTSTAGFSPLTGGGIGSPRTTWTGNVYNTYPGGHPFATRRSMDMCIYAAKADTTFKAKLEKIMRATVDQLDVDKDGTAAAENMLVLGNFDNEARVNLDMTVDGIKTKMAVAALRKSYGTYRDITPDGSNSEWFVKNKGVTGYSSANPIHAMLASSEMGPQVMREQLDESRYNQQWSYDTMMTALKGWLEEAITLLRQEKDNTGDNSYAGPWGTGIRRIGSVLHTIQDSAVVCTKRHWELNVNEVKVAGKKALQNARDCLQGDGHSYMDELTRKVKAFSDNIFYTQRHDFHEALDELYEEGRVLPTEAIFGRTPEQVNRLYAAEPSALWGSEDPAIEGYYIIRKVVEAAMGTDAVDVAAKAIMDAHVYPRWVARKDLKMITLEEAQAAKDLYRRQQEVMSQPKVKKD